MNITDTISCINDYFNNKLYLDNNTLLNYIISYDNIIDILIDTKPKYIDYIKENVQLDFNIYHSSSLLKYNICKNFKINYNDDITILSKNKINKFNNISGIVNIEIINLNDLKILYNIINNNLDTISSITLVCCRFNSSSMQLNFNNILFLFKLYRQDFPLKINYNSKFFKLDNLYNLKSISFEYCNENTFKIFELQENLKKITVKSDISTHNDFLHKYFNKISDLNKIFELISVKVDTIGYCNTNILPSDIETLYTTCLTYYRHDNNKNDIIKYFKSKKGYLQHLTIHHLPFDFNGGKILKYIIEEMNLFSFNYDNISLIKNKKKQYITKFSATEYHITSIYEMFKQYDTITTFTLNLNESIVLDKKIFFEINNNKNLNIFNNLSTLIINDNSGKMNLLRLFITFIKQLYNINTIIFNTQDLEINNILTYINLKSLSNLEEISLSSIAPEYIQRLNIIKNNVPKLKKLTIDIKYIYEANKIFDKSIDIFPYK
jgi:hypothetical protein